VSKKLGTVSAFDSEYLVIQRGIISRLKHFSLKNHVQFQMVA